MVTKRRATSLTELVLAFVVLGTVLGPAIFTMKKQLQDTRWSNEHLMAMQLANEVLDYYKHIGYDGIRLALTNSVPPAAVPLPLDGNAGNPINPYLVFDSWVGANNQHLWPPNKTAGPNGANPALGGPGDVHAGTFNTAPDFVSPMPVGTLGSESEVTLRRSFQFSRRVEILGGDAAACPGFQPMPGMGRGIDCYLIRVTIMNQTSMFNPIDQYQVVTVIARH